LNLFRKSQAGLTLLEVLIALSIFALIGVASFRVLSAVIESQRTAEEHSMMMNQFNTVMNILDSDFQQLATRSIRQTINAPLVLVPALVLNDEDYPIAFTRGGWRNPLKLSRSTLQRVAYGIGTHPQADQKDSQYYQDNTLYFLRYHWPHLDIEVSQSPQTRPLLANVNGLSIQVLDSNYIKHSSWPPEAASEQEADVLAIELSFDHESLGRITKRYRVN